MYYKVQFSLCLDSDWWVQSNIHLHTNFFLKLLKAGSIAIRDCMVALTCSRSSHQYLIAYSMQKHILMPSHPRLLGGMDGLVQHQQNKIALVEGSPDLPLVWGVQWFI